MHICWALVEAADTALCSTCRAQAQQLHQSDDAFIREFQAAGWEWVEIKARLGSKLSPD